MTFEKFLFSKSVLIPFIIALIFSIVLTFFPLIGTLGFEYAAVTAVLLSLLTVITASALISSEQRESGSRKSSIGSAGSIYFINFLMLLTVFIIGYLSSLLKDDCYIKEGTLFFLLIPTVSVFFSTSVGLFWGYILGRRGIIIGLVTILIISIYALWKLYYGVSLFVYNPIFGFFPGPLYDEAIPITLTLVISRISVLLWGIVILLALRIIDGLNRNITRIWDALFILVIAIAIITVYLKEPEIGISYTRDYITQNVLTGSVETDNFIIYYDPGSPEAKDLDLISMDHEWRYKQLREALELKSQEKIKSYIYPDTETRKKLIGAGETTIANPVHNEIHLIYDSFPHPVLKHELVHVMSGEFGNAVLKISPKIGLLEGIAVAADWRGQKYNPHQWSKVMIEMGIAPDVENIVGFGFWYAPAEVSYTFMGSFSKYLIDTYGIEKYKTAYKTGSFSGYGKDVAELELEWKEFLKTVETPPETKAIAEARFSRPSIFHAKCPRKIAELKNRGYEDFDEDNFHDARKNFSKALEYNNTDPALIYWLAYSHYYDRNFDRTLEITRSSSPETQIQKDLLRNLEGNTLWQTGDSEEAGMIFNDLLSHQLADSTKRELEIKLSAIKADSEVDENIKQFFGTRDEVLQLNALQNSILTDPFFAPSYYLKGRFFYNQGEYEKAVPELIRAFLLGLPTLRLQNENLKLLGICLFAGGKFDQSIAVFDELLLNEDNIQTQRYAQDFIDRANWIKEAGQ
jgi:tetratricopeptide (TPR) repeat protein